MFTTRKSGEAKAKNKRDEYCRNWSSKLYAVNPAGFLGDSNIEAI